MSSVLECGCGKKLKVKEEWAGRKVKCPSCQAVLRIPASDQADGSDSYELRVAEEPTPTADTEPCPNCGFHLPHTAHLCSQCGFDFITGNIRNAPPPGQAGAAGNHEPEESSPGATSTFLTALWARKAVILVVGIGIVALATIWLGLEGMRKPDSGPYEVTYKDHGDQLEMQIFWHCLALPNEPTDDKEATAEAVEQWYMLGGDGTKIPATWKATKFKHTVSVVFLVDPSSTVHLRKEGRRKHEVHLDIPSGPGKKKFVMEWFG